MPKLVMPKYTVLRDYREKIDYGWMFNADDAAKKSPLCTGTETVTLETGDYTIAGYEDILTIERKADFSELWVNYMNKDRFDDECARLSMFKYAFLIIEASLEDDIFQLSPPQIKTNVPGSALIRWIINLCIKNRIQLIFAGQCGRRIAKNIFQEVIRIEKDRWVPQTSR